MPRPTTSYPSADSMTGPTGRVAVLFSTIAAFLLGVLFLGTPSEAGAQIVFDVQLSERGQRMISGGGFKSSENMGPKDLARIIGEHATVTYEGERPVKGRFLAFFYTSDGERVEQVDLGRFEVRPGEYRLGEFLPQARFAAVFEEMIPDGYFAAKELDFFPSDIFFPCSIFDPAGRDFAAKDLVFGTMKVERGRAGFVLTLHPDHDVEREKVQIRPIRFGFGS